MSDTAAEQAWYHTPCGLFCFDDQGVIQWANPTLHEWLGEAPQALVGRSIERMLSPASRVFHSTHLFPLLKLHGHADEVFMTWRSTNGELPVLVNARRDTSGEAPLNHCALMPVRQRTEFEAALVKARQEAEAAAAARDEFLAVVSHELRSPLSAILGWVAIARRVKMDQVMQERAFETIERNAKAQSHLIEDLLDVSRIVSGKMRLSPRPIALGPVVESAVDTVRPAAAARPPRG